MDLEGGRYATFEEEWILDGSPSLPYRRSIGRREIAGSLTITPATMYVIAVPVQLGDAFTIATLPVKTATGTPTHSWVALYNGVTAGAQLMCQSADSTSGFTVGANVLAVTTILAPVYVSGTVGTPQSGGPITPSAAAVWGVVIYNSGGSGAVLDSSAAAGSIAGEVIKTGQIPLVQTASLSATATAPATLPALTEVASAIPYVLLSRS
jgi:hypothetical protein